MIRVIYVQMVLCFIGGYVYRDFWRDLQSHEDGAGLWVRFWALAFLIGGGFALGEL